MCLMNECQSSIMNRILSKVKMPASTQAGINQTISSNTASSTTATVAVAAASSASSSSIIKSLSDEKSKSKQMEKESNISSASASTSTSSTSGTKDGLPVVKDFVSHSWKLKENTSFEEEYKSISKSLTKAILHENEKRVFYVDEEHEFKNRYSNVLCFSDTRVVLKPLPSTTENEEEFITAEQDKAGCDYINASFIRGASGNVEYICSQAPVDDTIVDFWRMIWQEDIQIVLMLTPLVEGGRRKSSAYFPDKAKTSLTFAQESTQLSVKVTCEECDVIIEGLTHRKMNIDLMHGEKKLGLKTISHIHFTEWPDFGVGDEEKLVLLIDFVDSSKTTARPMIVHCSAGIGRSGTYCAIDIAKNIIIGAKKQDGKESKIDVPSIVSSLRNQRPGMVQTAGQYELIYKIVLKWMEKKGYL